MAAILKKLTKKGSGNTTIDKIIKNSEEFDAANPFPIESVRVKRLIKRFPEKINLIEKFAKESYPIVHEDVLTLMSDFLNFKLEHGSKIEKSIYMEMTVPKFVDRLLYKRPLVFLGGNDSYVLRDKSGSRRGGFENIGQDGLETPPLIMKDYLTYDEIKISALLATSSHTLAINKGARYNQGKEEDDLEKFINEAVIIGLVGARFERTGRMERQEILVHEKPEGDFHCAPIFSKFYGLTKFPTYEEASSNSRFLKTRGEGLFNTEAYKKRIRVVAETFLFEADHRAKIADKKAYAHVVGLGLGVWRIHEDQIQIYVDVFGEILMEYTFDHISDVDFSWIPVTNVTGFKNGDEVNGVKIHISKRNFFEKLPLEEDQNKLLVISWAYDGNSYPGNEFWNGDLVASGDPQAACSTQISELHNPQINPWFSGTNLHILSKRHNCVLELLSKRPLVFCGVRDLHLLQGNHGKGCGGFEAIGKDGEERAPRLMRHYLTYDEMKISALLGCSCYTLTLNKGNRNNKGIVDEETNQFTTEALIVGLVGPRLHRKNQMERQEIIINDPSEVGACKDLFAKLYNTSHFTKYEESLASNSRYIPLKTQGFFDTLMYEKRIEITAEMYLREAEHRASLLKKMAYVHVVGLGLGVWQVLKEQEQLFVDVFGKLIQENSFSHISDIDFSWIPVEHVCGVVDGGRLNNIQIHISKRDLFDKLPEEHRSKLLVVSWAYDGNSYPGNEFWMGSLDSSGDPQAACSTQISELLNPKINPYFCGESLKVVSNRHKENILKYKDYLEKKPQIYMK